MTFFDVMIRKINIRALVNGMRVIKKHALNIKFFAERARKEIPPNFVSSGS